MSRKAKLSAELVFFHTNTRAHTRTDILESRYSKCMRLVQSRQLFAKRELCLVNESNMLFKRKKQDRNVLGVTACLQIIYSALLLIRLTKYTTDILYKVLKILVISDGSHSTLYIIPAVNIIRYGAHT